MATNKPDLTRVWAATAPSSNVVDPDVTTPGKVAAGWQAEVPPFEHFNFLQKWFTQGLAHFNEQGIGIWDANTVYPVGGLAKGGTNGILYRCNIEQNGNDPVSDGGINWSVLLEAAPYNTISDMVADTSLTVGMNVQVLGYHTEGDGGGGQFEIVASGTGTADGGSYIDLATHQAKGIFSPHGRSILRYGAKVDGVTDDATAIQAVEDALGEYGTVLLPSGKILVGSTIEIRGSYRTYRGMGSGATSVMRTDGNYGDTFDIAHATPATNFLLGIVFEGLKIRANVEMNSGSHLHLQEVTQSTFRDVFLEDGYIGCLIEGGRNLQFSDFKIEAGKYFPILKTGSRFVNIAASPNAAQENTEIGFNGFNWTFTINATIDVGLEIEEIDGAWFSNGHILGAATSECLFNFGSTSQLTGCRFDNVWFDGFTDVNLVFSNAPTGAAKDFTFNGCTFSGATTYCVQATATAVFGGAQFNGCSFENCDASGVKITSGTNWQFIGCKFTDIDRLNAPGTFAIQSDNVAAIDKITVSGCDIGKDSTIDYGVRILNGSTEFAITGNTFEGISVNELDLLTTAELKGSVSGNYTDRASFNDITGASAMVIPAIADSCNVIGTSSTINNINPRWEGRKIAFRGATASHVISHGAGNIINQSGAGTTLGNNRALNYQYIDAGNAFYQIG